MQRTSQSSVTQIRSDGPAQAMAGKMRRSSKEILLAPHGLYDVHEMLGQGGIGTVWLATYKNNGASLASAQPACSLAT